METILILGGVAAGATAAARARRLSPTARITILEAGPDISFANCGLPYYIGGDIENRSSLILQSPESFKQQYDVDVHVLTRAESIDREAHVVRALDVRTGEHREFPYTKLILAQGGRPILPDLPGANLPHVFSLWTLDDMDRIDAFLKRSGAKVAVIGGGGFIGLEMAEALVHRGLEVHVVEKLPHVMAVMDPEISGAVEEELSAHGVRLHKGTGVASIGADRVTLEDGTVISAGMVLMSIGVRPTLQLARDAGLEIGPSGGLLVDRTLRTSDPSIWAAGDMVEIEHRIHGAKVRIPLAGPANRQGRIAAENALGGTHPYGGALGTSIVRVFDLAAGMTGLSLKAARAAGLDAVAVTVHKEHHTAYYPGAKNVTVRLIVERPTGRILGGQTAGEAGADRRLDAIAVAAYSGMSVHQLADVDLSYSPPLGTANDALNMAAFVAENRLSGYSPSLSPEEIDGWVREHAPLVVDLRDTFAFEKGHVDGAVNIPLELLAEQVSDLPRDRAILLMDGTGKKGHQALRSLVSHHTAPLVNVSGGFTTLLRHARAVGFTSLGLSLPEVAAKTNATKESRSQETPAAPAAVKTAGPLVVDMRSPGEFATGAYPGAVNIPLDTLPSRLGELGGKAREIIVYCASGARSGYAERLLSQEGFSNVRNGGGLAQMMRSAPTSKPSQPVAQGPLVVDVRSPGEFATGAYPGAVNIPVDQLPQRLGELGSKDREIVLYCASGARSGYAAGILQQSGFSNITNGGGLVHMMRRRG